MKKKTRKRVSRKKYDTFLILEKKAFRSKMKNHYKGEFNMAALMKAKPDWDADEDDQ